jgi:hypothetical protein
MTSTSIAPSSPVAPMADWANWVGVDGYSGFKVESGDGRVEMAQIGSKNFLVATRFVFADATTLDRLQAALVADGRGDAEARAMVDAARTFAIDDELTDLASVPQFMAWFEAPYGRHTLAAMIHDRLITDGEPNTGALMSDTLSDSFFRNMMGVAGVPTYKRWIMWAAVAMRTRWAAKGLRRISLLAWIGCAIIGNTCAISAVGQGLFGWGHSFGASPWLLAAIALVLPVASGVLWGRQFGASVVAAAAGIWLFPAAAIALVSLLAYHTSERLSPKRPTGGSTTWDPPSA